MTLGEPDVESEFGEHLSLENGAIERWEFVMQ